jgi:hypothetical protein
MALQPVGSGSSIASGASASHAKFSHQTDVIRVYADGCTATVAVGNTAVAAVTDFIIPANHEPETINIGRPSAQRVVGVTTTDTTTIIDFPEGTGAPFFVGQRVSLTVTDPQNRHFEFTDKPIASINNTAGVGGYFGTRLVVTHSYGAIVGVHTAYVDGPSESAELRDVVHISALAKPNSHGNAATGAVYFQQVQVTSGA